MTYMPVDRPKASYFFCFAPMDARFFSACYWGFLAQLSIPIQYWRSWGFHAQLD